nr:pentatricopeptide repeat protein AaPPR78 [Agave angustifolia]
MIVCIRNSLSSITSKHHIHQLHARVIATGLIHDPFVAGNLLESFLRLSPSSLSYSRALLFSSPNPSTFMYNTLIGAHVSNNFPEIAAKLFDQMLQRRNTMPNNHTFPLVLKALSQVRDLTKGRCVHSAILKLGFDSDNFIQSALVHFYAICDRIEEAHCVFNETAERSLSSWTALLSGYAKCGDLETARKLFDEMPNRNAVSWAAMVSGYVQNGHMNEALVLYREMLVMRIRPCASVYVSILVAIAELGALQEGRWVHAYLERIKWTDWTTKLVTSLVHMYAKCGDLSSARQTFDRMRQREVDVWNAMIMGLGLHGKGNEALELFYEMVDEGIEPDDLTFVGVLSGCSHSGLVNEGMACFDSMTGVHHISLKVEHYSCMVDLLGRAGLLKEATELIESMPMAPNGRVWGSLFGACRVHGDIELGERVGKQLMELEPDRAGRYVLLANLYASTGRYEDAIRVRETMKSRGVELEPGCSSIEIDGVIHEFLVGDRAHPRAAEIYDMLDEIEKKLRLRGYIADTKHVLFDISEDEKEGVLFWHSEKLAIAFALIATSPGDVIRIAKNLRICGDCHSMAKAVAEVYRREIVVRDRSRFHHFRRGSCSCSDYW